MVVGLIAIVMAFTFYTAKIDAEHLDNNQWIYSHDSRWMQRCCFFITFGFIHWWYFFAAALLFTALFDQVLNKYRGKPFLYLGSFAKWDLFFIEKKWLYITIKILALLISIALFSI